MSTSKPINTLFIFCEGTHDVAFLSRVLKDGLKFSGVKWTFSEYPAPLNQFFRQSIEKHAAKDMSLDMTHKFFLPDKVFIKNNHLILLFNSGGKTKASKICEMLSKLLPLLEMSEQLIVDPRTHVKSALFVDTPRYMFLYDADEWGLQKTCSECTKWFGQIDNNTWIDTDWNFETKYPFAATNNDKALYILGETPQNGTLEDWLQPLFSKKDANLISKAEVAIDEMFHWKLENKDSAISTAEISKRKKAILTFAGQRKKPGSSLSVILEQAKMFNKGDFKNDQNVMSLANFISDFTNLST